jgi:hypothetical protein
LILISRFQNQSSPGQVRDKGHRFFAFSPISTRRRMASYYLEIRRMSLAAVLRNVKTDPLAFVQCRKSRPLDVTNMDEHVRPAAVGLNEAKALTRIKPFHFACQHQSSPECCVFMKAARAAWDSPQGCGGWLRPIGLSCDHRLTTHQPDPILVATQGEHDSAILSLPVNSLDGIADIAVALGSRRGELFDHPAGVKGGLEARSDLDPASDRRCAPKHEKCIIRICLCTGLGIASLEVSDELDRKRVKLVSNFTS